MLYYFYLFLLCFKMVKKIKTLSDICELFLFLFKNRLLIFRARGKKREREEETSI